MLFATQHGNKPPVYPRWRGEHHDQLWESVRKIGLSPLARGTLAGFWQTAARHRFIPAGAGNTRLEKAAMESDAVYPRWRGEHKQARGRECTVRGLSPLARGTPARA